MLPFLPIYTRDAEDQKVKGPVQRVTYKLVAKPGGEVSCGEREFSKGNTWARHGPSWGSWVSHFKDRNPGERDGAGGSGPADLVVPTSHQDSAPASFLITPHRKHLPTFENILCS